MNTNTLIGGTDSTSHVMHKMSKGNPGARMTLMEMWQRGTKGMLALMMLDTFGIYGTDIYVLHNDICSRNIERTINVITNAQRGHLDPAVLKDACSRQDYSGKNMIDSKFFELIPVDASRV